MLQTSTNRATPISVDNITKVVRQHYNPVTDLEYNYEKVQCRTDTTCQRSKPEDYWTTNFHRRKANMQRGFYSSSTEPYRPIGGELILDPCELVLTTFPGTHKVNPRMARRGTIFDDLNATNEDDSKDKVDLDTSSFTSQDLVDTAPSAGYSDIKKLLKETRNRITSVRAGKSYENHVKEVEEKQRLEKEASKPEVGGMVLKSVSSIYMAAQTGKGSEHSSRTSSRISSLSAKSGISSSGKLTLSECVQIPTGDQNGDKARLRPPSLKTKMNLMHVGAGITNIIYRKERQFKDHTLYLESIYKVLTALHNMKVRDIKSKTPLPRELVERLQRPYCKEEDGRGSHGTHVSRATGRNRGSRFSTHTFGASNRRPSVAQSDLFSEFGDTDDFSPRKPAKFLPPINQRAKLKVIKPMQKKENPQENRLDNLALTLLGNLSKKPASKVCFNKQFMNLKNRRKSRVPNNIVSERPPLETWEDLLNVQPEPYKEEVHDGGAGSQGGLALQIGVVAKFMRWYRKTENSSTTTEKPPPEKRRASIVPSHGGPGPAPAIDRNQLSHLQEIHEKGAQGGHADKGERDTHGHQVASSATANPTERVKKLPIWQQVAQEKSTVFEHLKKKAPDPDGAIQRFKKNLNKLKRSVQKENTATMEKITRERVANFRLIYSALECEECSPLFEEQRLKLQGVKDKVNKSHLENFDVQPSKWFEELREKSTSLVSSYNQPQIFDILAKIQTYAHMDNKTVNYAKAKLCLLMMSLPAYDICQIHMQKALKFIFENILLGQEAQFYEWLNHRKIPSMIIDELSRSNVGSPVNFTDTPSPTRFR